MQIWYLYIPLLHTPLDVKSYSLDHPMLLATSTIGGAFSQHLARICHLSNGCLYQLHIPPTSLQEGFDRRVRLFQSLPTYTVMLTTYAKATF